MALMTLTLSRREPVAERTTAFHFEKPARFQFKAGQTLDFTLINPPETDAEGDTRTFSIASAPHEEDLVVATRIRSSAFKRALSSVPLGTAVKAEGPMGSFTLHNNAAKPAVFLTGGIGITPFRSMVFDVAARRTGPQMWLFYSNNRPEDAAFLDEMRALADSMPTFHFVPTMTDIGKSTRPWHGQTGLINRELLESVLSGLQGPIYYLAGPPAMVTALRNMLVTAGVDEDDVRAEEFAGY